MEKEQRWRRSFLIGQVWFVLLHILSREQNLSRGALASLQLVALALGDGGGAAATRGLRWGRPARGESVSERERECALLNPLVRARPFRVVLLEPSRRTPPAACIILQAQSSPYPKQELKAAPQQLLGALHDQHEG